MTSFIDAFQRVYVINLSRREERWNEFFQGIPKNWPFRFPERYLAIDGGLVSPPEWWQGGVGAWGCYKTHLRIMEDCLNNDISSVLILEDDAVFIDGFNEKVDMFWRHLPDDWEMVYFGGQHIQDHVRLPRKVNEWVYKPYNVNRTHCYGFRHRNAIEKAYKHLNNFPDWKAPHHVDHRLGELHKRMEQGLYAPKEWLVAQSEGQSDISARNLERRLFAGCEELVYPPIPKKGIAVFGDYFGGTNTLAGTLYHLGISLGVDMHMEKEDDVPQYFEDQALREICRQSFEEPWFLGKLAAEDRANHLRRWAGWQCKQQPEGAYFCGKHPLLSLMGEEVLEAWCHPKFLVMDRPSEQSIAALKRQPWAWHPSAVKFVMGQLKESREDFLAKHSPVHLRISFEELSRNPEKNIDTLCTFLNYEPTSQQRDDAFRFLRLAHDDCSFGFLKRPAPKPEEEKETSCHCKSCTCQGKQK